jgi:hypothetical protein
MKTGIAAILIALGLTVGLEWWIDKEQNRMEQQCYTLGGQFHRAKVIDDSLCVYPGAVIMLKEEP